jgi:hypothetical protein
MVDNNPSFYLFNKENSKIEDLFYKNIETYDTDDL